MTCELSPIMFDIWLMLRRAKGWLVTYAPRETNRVAHNLAKLAFTFETDQYWLKDCPNSALCLVENNNLSYNSIYSWTKFFIVFKEKKLFHELKITFKGTRHSNLTRTKLNYFITKNPLSSRKSFKCPKIMYGNTFASWFGVLHSWYPKERWK